MKLILTGLLVCSAAATPDFAPIATQVVSNGPTKLTQVASSSAYKRQMALWEDKQTRLQLVSEELDGILEDVIELGREEAQALDPILVELYVRKTDLEEILLASQEGFKTGLISVPADVNKLQAVLDSEIGELESAVEKLRVVLDDYLNAMIEV